MTQKAVIKAKIRRLKYYDSQLNERRALIEQDLQMVEDDDVAGFKRLMKNQKRFTEETELCMKLFQVFQLKRFPKTYDILENPKQIMTQKEARIHITSTNTANERFVKKGPYTFMYIPGEELKILEEVYNEMTIK